MYLSLKQIFEYKERNKEETVLVKEGNKTGMEPFSTKNTKNRIERDGPFLTKNTKNRTKGNVDGRIGQRNEQGRDDLGEGPCSCSRTERFKRNGMCPALFLHDPCTSPSYSF